MRFAPDRRKCGRTLFTCAAVSLGVACAAAAAQLPPELLRLVNSRNGIVRDLSQPIARCIVRRDTTHPAFHGCIDWHSAAHAAWALTAYTRVTGDKRYVPVLDAILTPDAVRAEFAYLREHPAFEMPYGRAWFLRLAVERGRTFGDGLLDDMADHVARSLLDHYRQHAPVPFSFDYDNASWALVSLLEFAESSGKNDIRREATALVRERFIAARSACDPAAERSGFMAVCTNWAWLVAKVLPDTEFERWFAGWKGPLLALAPVRSPVGAHHFGMNFSRSWGLWALFRKTGDPDFAASYARHFTTSYSNRAHWDGDYYAVGHWVAQFGMLAALALFEPGMR